LSEFLHVLSNNGIEIVIDIRAVPYSRRKEYSKKNLAERLKEEDIDYRHVVELGSPKELRDKVKIDDDYGYFFNEYKKYLGKQPEALKGLIEIASDNTVCLLCYERDINRCHRQAVAEAMQDMAGDSIEISHL